MLVAYITALIAFTAGALLAVTPDKANARERERFAIIRYVCIIGALECALILTWRGAPYLWRTGMFHYIVNTGGAR